MSCEYIFYRQRPLPRGRADAFTLVEMLTVMAVIGILLAVGLPGWLGLNSTGVRRSAVTRVMGVFDQARSIAISEGKYTYVAFSSPSQDPDPSRWGRACAIYVEDNDFRITQRSPWVYLPGGMAFKIDPNNGTSSIMNRPAPTDGSTPPSFPVSTPTGPKSATLPYMRFDNTGGVDEQNSLLSRVLMFPGKITSAGSEAAFKHVDSSANQSILLDEVRVNSATGRAKYIVNVADNLATPSPIASNP